MNCRREQTLARSLGIVSVLLLGAMVPLRTLGEEAVFDLREAAPGADLQRGQVAYCTAEPDAKVKGYPPLKSKSPWYGVVKVGREYGRPDSGTEYHFVVDESGEAPPAAPAAEEPSLLESLARALAGSREPDRRPVARGRYDRLYFDLNGDLDLTNDPVRKPAAKAPFPASRSSYEPEGVAFDDLSLPFDFGPGLGTRPFAVVPRFVASEYDGKPYGTMCLVAKTAREGRIRIGSREYEAVLGQRYLISGRFDRPSTALLLTAVGASSEREYWWGHDELCAMREVDGQFFSTSTTPLGDKLTVRKYEGDWGLFEAGAGGRNLQELEMTGSLRSADTAVAVGGGEQGVRQCRLPVGDYLPSYLSFTLGDLRISVSDNYHRDGRPRDFERQRVYGIQIRKDKPFVLDFSNKPEVMFASPARDQTYAPGANIEVKGVLTDPVLDIMIRRLVHTASREKETIKLSNGREQTIERQRSLDPVVTITDSAGKVVSEGKMPFG
jgi:hypothetical protein